MIFETLCEMSFVKKRVVKNYKVGFDKILPNIDLVRCL